MRIAPDFVEQASNKGPHGGAFGQDRFCEIKVSNWMDYFDARAAEPDQSF
jgi:hypothetical protein